MHNGMPTAVRRKALEDERTGYERRRDNAATEAIGESMARRISEVEAQLALLDEEDGKAAKAAKAEAKAADDAGADPDPAINAQGRRK